MEKVMTICVAEGIIENPNSPVDAIGRRFVQWYKTDPPDIGITCQDAIAKFIDCGDWKEAGLRVFKCSDAIKVSRQSIFEKNVERLLISIFNDKLNI